MYVQISQQSVAMCINDIITETLWALYSELTRTLNALKIIQTVWFNLGKSTNYRRMFLLARQFWRKIVFRTVQKLYLATLFVEWWWIQGEGLVVYFSNVRHTFLGVVTFQNCIICIHQAENVIHYMKLLN